ncbi:MAG: alpha-2-macroglobulin [Treponema sp.]|jgi:uncharacterized protein YfaS (alpha-2-macroglobulin family)|nr:alpha-2-macroglobulin [Treponema sp.]
MTVKKMSLRVLCVIVVSAAGVAGITACNRETSKISGPDPQIVSAVTGGIVPRNGEIEVVFTGEQDSSKPLSSGFLRIKPAVKGTLAWRNSYTLVFTPASLLLPSQRYEVTVGNGASEINPFAFSFETRPPLTELTLEPVRVDGEGNVLVSGILAVDEGEDPGRVERVVSSPELGKPQWTHEEGTYRFAFKPAKRESAGRTVSVVWDGSALGSKDKGSLPVYIPGSGSFEAVDFRIRDRGVLEVTFSAPLKPDQDLRGFVSLSGDTNIRYSIDGNVVKIFGAQGSEGVSPGAELLIQDLADIDGNVLVTPVQYRVQDGWELPEARFAGSGTVLPTSQGSTMVIETRNLTGVLVEAFRIYGDNMIQFLQVNGLGGTNELVRVGEPEWTRAFDFDWSPSDQNRWVRRGLDISELARKYPDGMFHIRLSFRRRHIRYECTASHGDFSQLQFPDDTFPAFGNDGGEQSYWDYWEDNRTYDWYRYRKDPCHPAFYAPYGDHNITVGRNVLVSDLGLLAKRSLDGGWFVAASNIKTAQPLADTDIDILNYQGRLLSRVKTGRDGIAAFPALSPGIPAFVYARSPAGRAWLKINDSLAMAVSHFDVSGDRPASDLRGLIYGERGVWRPGDDIFLTFLLSDPAGTLPADHPVSFELEDPRGHVTEQRIFTSSVDGFYPIKASTSVEAPTGDWTARVRVGGRVFNKNLKIETVMPNRLKMDLNFGDKGYLGSGPRPVSLDAAWLYGAPAPGLRADVSVSLADRDTTFSSYTDYSFRDPSRTVSSERQVLYEGKLDDAGKASFTVRLDPGSAAPGKLNARFLTRVFEPSGVFSSEQVSMEFSPYERYVGIKLPRGDASRNMLLTDTDHQADIVVLDGEGRAVTGGVRLECAVYKLSWRWWWEKGSEEAAEFASTLSRRPLVSETVTASGGRAAWKFQVKYPEWGRYLVMVRDPSGGHAAASVVYIDWPGWAGRAQEGGQGASAMLVLSPGKGGYSVNEKISVTFPSNKEAAALITVEKGGQALKREWIPCAETVTRYEFNAEPSMIPNVYVHVTLLQPHLQTRNDLPLRLYGITPVAVEDPRTRLGPKIEAPEKWEPESPVTFTVSETSGRPMTYTVAVVDEGLLGLTRFKLPDPRSTFYAREASFLKSWDLYSDIMGAYAGQLETLLSIGGGDDLFDDSAKETKRFKPVVRFFGPYELKAGEKRNETFTLPSYIGALRIMVLGASSLGEQPVPYKSGRAYGTAEKSVQVSSDIMVFGTIPRTLSPGDEAEIPVAVNSYTGGKRTVKVTLAVEGLDLEDGGVQTLSFEKPGEQMIRYRVKAPSLPGKARLTLRAESAGLRASSQVTDLEVRSTAIPVTKAASSLVSPNDRWKDMIRLPGKPGTNTGVMEFSRLPPLNLEERLEYLIAYPHGCIEQTTSSVFPQLYLDKLLSLDPDRVSRIRSNITAGIERLGSFQISGGGFSYWPGDGTPHDWGTSYAGHFLLEARRAGYVVPASLIKNWAAFQKERAGLWSARTGSVMEQAYRLYTLALAGETDLGSMNRLREQRDLGAAAAWRLAAAYWHGGQRDTARSMVRDLETSVTEYRELSGTFGSALRDKAMILETLVLLGDTGRTKPLFEELSAALSSDAWLSTQETAYALIAMTPYMQGSAGTGELTVDYVLEGKTTTVSFKTPVIQCELGSLAGTSAVFAAHNRSAVPVYARIVVKGLPDEGAEPAISEGLSLQVEYRDAGGSLTSPDALGLGEDMEVRVTVRNNQRRKVPEIAVVHPVPASWELVNSRLAGDDSDTVSSFKYQDIRDDRVMTYFDLERGASKTVSFRVNKTYGGTYYRPAIHAYAMYDESIRALVPGVKGGK